MASARRIRKGAAVLGVVAAIALIAIPAALAAFGAKTQNEGDTVTAAATIGFAHVGTSAMSHIAAIFPSTT